MVVQAKKTGISAQWIVILLITILLIGHGCNEAQKTWRFEKKILLPTVSRPLSLGFVNQELWYSDPDYFRLYKTDREGNLLDSITGIKRPMNIHSDGQSLYIPEFLTDTIWQYEKGIMSVLPIKEMPKAPAGIFVHGDTVAIADFYNHRVILQLGEKVSLIGREGHKEGQLYYPIDVKIFDAKVYVADAYNNRIQVFDLDGLLINTIGEEDNIKVASGIAVNNHYLAVTDQENKRVLIYNPDFELLQTLTENIDYPTDVLLKNDLLYIANFKTNAITIYSLQ